MKQVKKSMLSVLTLSTISLAAIAGCGTSGGSTASSNSTSNATASTSGSSADKTTAIGVNAVVDTNAMPTPGEVVIAVDNTYAPMEYMNPNNPTQLIGFDADLGDALSNYIHEKIVWKPTQWDGILPGLLAKKYDIILSSMNDTADRRKQIDFVDYMSFGQIIVVKKGSTANIQSMNDLKGKTVGVQIATTSDDALHQMGGLKAIKEYNTIPEVFQDLANGRLDAVVVDEVVGRYYVALQPNNFQFAGTAFASEPVGIGIRKDETDLEKKLTAAIAQMKADGTYQKIYSYWFGSGQ